jgi:hypothetical protein
MTSRENTPPSGQISFPIPDFTPKNRKGTSVSEHRSDTDGNRADNPYELRAWADEFRRHHAVPNLSLDEFLKKYVPSDTVCPGDSSSVAGTFHNVPLDKKEPGMYDPLVSIVSMPSQSV